MVRPVLPVRKDSIITILLFILLTLSAGFLSVGRLTLTPPQSIYDLPFFPGMTYEQGGEPHLWSYLLTMGIYLGCLIPLVWHLSRHGQVRPRPALWIPFALFALFRLLSCFLYPYGPQELSFISPFENHPVIQVEYTGFSIYGRIVTYTEELGFYGYFLFYYTYRRCFDTRVTTLVRHILYVLYGLFLISLVLYSLIKEYDAIIQNIRSLFGLTESCFYNIQSYMTNRNVLGWFYFIGAILCVVCFFERPNAYSIVFYLLLTGFCLIIFSRTPTLLLVGLASFLMIIYAPLSLRNPQRRKYAIVLLAMLLCFAVLVILISTIWYESYWKDFSQRLFDSGTLHGRQDLTKACLSMMTPYTYVFGYTKMPYVSIFRLYRPYLPVDPTVQNTHNGYANILMEAGIPGLTIFVAVLLIYAIRILVHGIRHKNMESFGYLALEAAICLYGYSESNIIFLREVTDLFYLAIFIFPLEAHLDLARKRAFQIR